MATTTTRRGRRPARTAADDTARNDLLDLYIAELSQAPMRASGEQKALARRMRDSTLSAAERERCREELISSNLRFAFSIAKQFQHRGLPLEDLVSEANAGLCHAADKYDPDVGVNFISYAVWWIRQAIFSAITKTSRSVRVPLNRAADLTRVSRAQAVLREKLHREPTREEIAKVAELSEEVVDTLMGLMAAERSLDEPIGDGGETFGNLLVGDMDESEDAVTADLEEQSRRESIMRALEPLPARDRKIVILYYGLESGESMTLEEIAQVFGVTRERIRQIRDRAVKALRENGAADHLKTERAA
ncbi:MAG: RNA polymerase sigma factor RpoD/SigA [Gemmatimonadaceae bacterium]